MKSLVSIGMPVFNCEKTLNSAVNSILHQTYSNWELILIDDGSKDKTLKIAKSFEDSRIKVVSDGLNKKLPTRLNQSIAMSKGKYFARMDGDDISFPERLQTQVEYLEAHPNIDLLGTGTIIFGEDGQATGKFSGGLTHSEICFCPWKSFNISHPTWIGKIDWFRSHHYRENAIRMEDYDLLLRTYKTSQFACLSDILLGYRIESLSLKKILNARYYNSIALSRQAFTEKNYLFAYGVLEQLIKALVDTFAITTGLNFKILKHRIGCPIEATEIDLWKEVWAKCNSDVIVKPH
jgi:glycosyltransferase involved in cell wall biosynthesis